jgi:hypothetical protein
MAESRPGWTAFLITVSPLPGKYELYTLVEEHSFQDKGVWLTVTTSTTDIPHHIEQGLMMFTNTIADKVKKKQYILFYYIISRTDCFLIMQHGINSIYIEFLV